MSFYGITADYNGPLQQVKAHTDDDRYDMVELGAAGESLIGASLKTLNAAQYYYYLASLRSSLHYHSRRKMRAACGCWRRR